jgi:hypothetical protein
MKVKDLIKILEKYNQNAEVFISDLNTLTDEKNSFKYIDSNILHNKYKETCDYVGLIGEEFFRRYFWNF